MKKRQADKIILLSISIILAFAYTSYTVKSSKLDLTGCWIESFKNKNYKKDSITIYTPCKQNSLLPTERFRFKINLRKNESCNYYLLDNNNSHSMQSGTWLYNNKNFMLIIKNSNNEIVKLFKVIEIKKNMLYLELKK
ncbi:hypothetical protein AWE51_14865 [Aquimarina aggregata]|uniref:Lipocalin-like domain-containing protein n=1 Tax=Aquimarina aggregata TaxID=1642818 RepID=A0A162XZY3_9FLAO|nr:hypothetical protein [Aquimarina aggregata]KZS38860.1 hypothetical protein AWE51_14865 [Aquimarina aggregata]